MRWRLAMGRGSSTIASVRVVCVLVMPLFARGVVPLYVLNPYATKTQCASPAIAQSNPDNTNHQDGSAGGVGFGVGWGLGLGGTGSGRYAGCLLFELAVFESIESVKAAVELLG